MVVDDVKNHRDAAGMRSVDEPAETVRSAVTLLDREDEGGVIAPGNVAGEFIGRHHLNGVDAEILEIVELADDAVEVAAPVRAGRVEQKAADMQLVDHQFVPRWGRIIGALPDIVRLGDDAVADRIGHRAGVGIVLPQERGAVGVRDDEFVLIVDLRARHVDGPVAVAFRG